MHEGHRERLIGKLLNNSSALSSHEVLEVLLFYAIPRKNTNELAHKLLDVFGTLEGVLTAEYDSLIVIDGVGHKTATFITTLNEIRNRIDEEKNVMPTIFSYDGCKQMLINSFRGTTEEKFVAFFLDKRGAILVRKIFSSHSDSMVDFDLGELLKGALVKNAHSAVICHNHLSGNPKPSFSDDRATEKIFLALRLHNVILSDHIIIAGDHAFSYRISDRLSAITKNLSNIIY